jgi:DNA-binding response OmpR family regulator/DNA-binding CsgD family transcriptional regulator
MLTDKRCSVLVVDDDAELLFSTVRMLKKNKFQVLSASDGDSAMKLIDLKRPDLVLLDVVMGPPDGIEVCRQIKKEYNAQNTPLVVLMSNKKVSSSDRILGLSSGADGYVLRPVSNNELLAQVQAFERICNYTKQQAATDNDFALPGYKAPPPKMESDVQQITIEDEIQSLMEIIVNQKKQLDEQTVAIRVLMKQFNQEQSRVEEYLVSNLRNSIIPILLKVIEQGGHVEQTHIDLINDQIANIFDPLIRKLDNPEYDLSGREKEICILLERGHSSQDIASLLNLSIHTVHTHRNRIRKKLGLQDRQSIQHGLRALA